MRYAFFSLLVVGFLFSTEGSAQSVASPRTRASGNTTIHYSNKKKSDEELNKESPRLRPEQIMNYRAPTVPSLASDFNKSLLDSDLQKKLEENYFYELHTFLYFHGYESTSVDVDTRNKYNIDPKEEYKIRTKMAKSIGTYFFSRALPRFLKTRDGTKGLGNFYEDTLKVTHIKAKVSDQGNYSWLYSSGLNPINLNAYMQLTNNIWRLAYEDESAQENTWAGRFILSRVYQRKFTSGVYYLSYPSSVHAFFDWQIRKNLHSGIDNGYYLVEDEDKNSNKTNLQVTYRF